MRPMVRGRTRYPTQRKRILFLTSLSTMSTNLTILTGCCSSSTELAGGFQHAPVPNFFWFSEPSLFFGESSFSYIFTPMPVFWSQEVRSPAGFRQHGFYLQVLLYHFSFIHKSPVQKDIQVFVYWLWVHITWVCWRERESDPRVKTCLYIDSGQENWPGVLSLWCSTCDWAN